MKRIAVMQLPVIAIRFSFFTFLLIIFYMTGFAPSVSLKGRVTDAKGQPLSGAIVKIKSSNNTTFTNKQGVFILNNTPANGTLMVTYVGFNQCDVKFTARKELAVSLEEAAAETEEVIVTGVFDKRKKLEASVAITTINSKEMSRLTPTSTADLLKNIPGVYVNQARGEIWAPCPKKNNT